MKNFYLYNFNKFYLFEQIVKENLSNTKIVIMCIGTKQYYNDSFGVIIGDRLKTEKIYSFGSSKREINGSNYMQTYLFLKEKFKSYKIVIIDSCISLKEKKPILKFIKGAVNVSCLNTQKVIGDYGILFNSFSYSKKENLEKVVKLLTKTFAKICAK